MTHTIRVFGNLYETAQTGRFIIFQVASAPGVEAAVQGGHELLGSRGEHLSLLSGHSAEDGNTGHSLDRHGCCVY